jgi:hypothetical protein
MKHQFCLYGHPLTPETRYMSNRSCSQCCQIRNRYYYAVRKNRCPDLGPGAKVPAMEEVLREIPKNHNISVAMKQRYKDKSA